MIQISSSGMGETFGCLQLLIQTDGTSSESPRMSYRWRVRPESPDNYSNSDRKSLNTLRTHGQGRSSWIIG